LIVASVDWHGATAGTSAEAMLGRPAAWRARRAKSILRDGAAAVGALDFDDDSGAQGAATAGDLLVAVDGRLDEVASLTSLLGVRVGSGDAELVLAAYRRWGSSFPSYLQGDFAIVLWDRQRRRLIATRDPLGVRPLFFALGNGRCFVASDVEPILASGHVSSAADDAVVVNYLRWTFADPQRTFFRDIRRVRPGHTFVATEAGVLEEDHRTLPTKLLGFADREECWSEYRRLFFQAVRRRLPSGATAVVHVSGGVDSTCIAEVTDAILQESSPSFAPVTAAAAIHPGLPCDESSYIRDVAESVHFEVETWDGTQADPDELERTPVSFPGGRYIMTGGTEGDLEIARRIGARVVLSGNGGDQLGISDGTIEDAIIEGRWRDALALVWGAPGSPGSRARRALSVAKALSPEWLRNLHRSRKSPERLAEWLTPWAASVPADAPAANDRMSDHRTHAQRRRWKGLTDPRAVLVTEYIQQYGVRAGLDMRFPFLDWDLARLVLAIPSRFLPPPWPQERLQREALGHRFPPRIQQRRTKADFSSAMARRVNVQLPKVRELFHSSDWRMGRYVERASALKCLTSFERASTPPFHLTWAVWACASIEAWLRASSGYTSSAGRPTDGGRN
jgi:asparagine synthase (glutamine-hydrolysing)